MDTTRKPPPPPRRRAPDDEKRPERKPASRTVTTDETPPTPRRVRLDTIEQVAREVKRVYRAMCDGTIPTQDGTRLTYTLIQLSQMLALVEFERRIALLERRTHGAIHGRSLRLVSPSD